jgi:SAM-dependent methyltransferase
MDEVTRFSEVGDRYGEQLARGLEFTGETADYFARGRIERVRTIAEERALRVESLLDFGCGTGSSFPLLRDAFPKARIIGFEPAPGLRDLARRAAVGARAEVVEGDALTLDGAADIVYCNGVFHHIPPNDRANATAAVARALRTNGLACIWENSPYNPGTRFIMSRVDFDQHAVLLTPRELRALHRAANLTPLATEFHFVFPRVLRFARALEPALRPLPFGGQYVVVSRRG